MRDERIKDKKFRKARCEPRDEILLPIASTKDILPSDYPKFLSEVKALVSAERTRAMVSANVGMTLMYWRIGKMIVARQDGEGWGAKVIDRLSYDLKKFIGRVWFFAVESAVAYVNHKNPTLATCDMFDCLARRIRTGTNRCTAE